jgi:hypothetical protein
LRKAQSHQPTNAARPARHKHDVLIHISEISCNSLIYMRLFSIYICMYACMYE